jgi:hypothetical protein
MNYNEKYGYFPFILIFAICLCSLSVLICRYSMKCLHLKGDFGFCFRLFLAMVILFLETVDEGDLPR